MFTEEFYPTPRKVIELMLKPYKEDVHVGGFNGYYEKGYGKLNNKIILEPHAGKGDIVDFITGKYLLKKEYYTKKDARQKNDRFHNKNTPESVKSGNIYCIEKDPNLRHILQEKDYKIISTDFLEYNGDYLFDLILMNPPFSNGDEHLLKAWDILVQGEIVCLLNAETVLNPYTEKRQLLKRIIDDFGTTEEIGKMFSDSERPTDVNVILVRLKKISLKKPLDFEFQEINKERKFKIDESTINDMPALKDVIGNMLTQYDKVKEDFIQFMKLYESLRHFGDPLISRQKDWQTEGELEIPKTDIVGLALHAMKSDTKNNMFNTFCDSMKTEMWDVVFQNIGAISSFSLEKLMTHSVRENWEGFMKVQGAMDFTRENVWSVIEMLFENRNNILERSIGEVFDIFTQYHSQNRYHIEGWKTNDKWKVNRKIILPYWVKMSWEKPQDRIRFGAEYKLSSHRNSEYSDIDKALCYITGKEYNRHTTIAEALESSFRKQGKIYKGPHTATCENDFFNMKYFMKGTLHLEFKDEKLWEEFNLRACAGKNWLPENEQRDYETRKTKSAPQEQLQLV